VSADRQQTNKIFFFGALLGFRVPVIMNFMNFTYMYSFPARPSLWGVMSTLLQIMQDMQVSKHPFIPADRQQPASCGRIEFEYATPA
jgi:hypothetical protein